ncbi:hypothetical protein [Sporisorium scitamineum]|uniref:Uncharacterized protein n=1 Tax=Sporisorium scitamineum TaxID=49012 RepID=A0A0F7S716_9BASI|nr:hypothetical protein [Sporisorium scitamineum]
MATATRESVGDSQAGGSVGHSGFRVNPSATADLKTLFR